MEVTPLPIQSKGKAAFIGFNELRAAVIALHERGEGLKNTPGLTFSHASIGNDFQSLAIRLDKFVADCEPTDVLQIRSQQEILTDRLVQALLDGLNMETLEQLGASHEQLRNDVSTLQDKLRQERAFNERISMRLGTYGDGENVTLMKIDDLQANYRPKPLPRKKSAKKRTTRRK